MTVSRRSFIGAIAAMVGLGWLVPKVEPAPLEPVAIDIEGNNLIAIDLLEIENRSFSNHYVDHLKESINKIGLIMPVLVAMVEGKYVLIDGLHRVIAYQCLNRPYIECNFIVMTQHQVNLMRATKSSRFLMPIGGGRNDR